jgi:hypothetical protein
VRLRLVVADNDRVGRGPRTASSRTGDSPWVAEDVARLASLLALGTVGIAVAWFGTSGATKWSTQTAWVAVAIAAVTIGAGSCIRWIIAGMRSTRLARREIVEELTGRWLDDAEGRPTTVDAAWENTVASAAAMTRFHRPTCQLAVGKNVALLATPEAVARHLTPCEMCAP